MINRKIAVIGLGYAGLPIAIAFGKHTKCIGFDTDSVRVRELQSGLDRTHEISQDDLCNLNVLYTSSVKDLCSSNFFIVAVPTPVDNANVPDLSALECASRIIGSVLKIGDIVVYESTVYPGATEEICAPILEEESKLRYNIDFTLGFSPERINPGDKTHGFTNTVKVVSGSDLNTLEIISSVYSSVIDALVYRASSIKVAEAAKVIENSQRDLNIAFMNELSVIFDQMGLDTLDVLETAGTKWNFLPFRPGLVGGHCVGIDPYYLTHKAQMFGYIPQVILSGRRINDDMAKYVARKGIKLLLKNNVSANNLNSAILGFAFKENCADVRNTKVVDIVTELEDHGICVYCVDHIVESQDVYKKYGIMITEFSQILPVSLLIVAVAHDDFRKMSIDCLLEKVKPGGVILDVKSILPKQEIIDRGYNLWRL